MTRIVTADDGTRCRIKRPLEEGERIPAGTYVLYKDAFKTAPPFGESVHAGNHDGPGWLLEPLPEIEGWPGYHPEQYLANSHEQPDTPVKQGDVLLLREPGDQWAVWVESVTVGVTLRNKDFDGLGVYLISRADPEEDAEESP